MNRTPLIAGNWKMYKTLGEAVETALALKPLVANANHCEIVIAPVFVHLKTVADRLEGSNVRVAAQDCADTAKQSANTGEVSPAMVKDVGCSHVIIGHSERRQFYGETDESAVGLYLSKEKPRMKFETRVCETRDLDIAPGVADAKHTATYCFKKDTRIFALSPHMHLRGKWFKFELLTPDGKRQTLLSVPAYDFNWQTTYRLAEPVRAPAGSWLICTGGFDNSAKNPHNPDALARRISSAGVLSVRYSVMSGSNALPAGRAARMRSR